jgi:hypothetical protein
LNLLLVLVEHEHSASIDAVVATLYAMMKSAVRS